MRFLFYFIYVMILYSCNKNKNQDSIIEKRTPSSDYHELYKEGYLDSLFTEISEKGDTLAYKEALDITSFYHVNADRTVIYTLKMAHIYNYPKAYYDVYNLYRFTCRDNTNCQQIGIYYLLKSHEMGYKESEFDLKNIFENNDIPYSENYLKEKDSSKIYEIPIY